MYPIRKYHAASGNSMMIMCGFFRNLENLYRIVFDQRYDVKQAGLIELYVVLTFTDELYRMYAMDIANLIVEVQCAFSLLFLFLSNHTTFSVLSTSATLSSPC